jgi:hypothetical protein
MSVRRENHTATLLQDGRVLVTGGITSYFVGADFLNSTEIYDPVSETWAASANMQFSRIHSTATLLPNGRVLIIGGEVNPSAGSVGEIFDPATVSFRAAAPLPVSLRVHTATALADGLVLVTFGGQETASSTTVMLYDYRLDKWIQPQPSPMPLDTPVTVRLNDGRVLIAEGLSEIFDPATRSFSSSGRPLFDISYPSRAVTLDNGRVYVCCGYNGGSFSSLTQIYDPSSASFEPGPETALQRTGAVPVKLKDGRVLIVGGAANYLFETPEINAEEYLPDIPLSFIPGSRPRTLGWRPAR